MLSLKLIHASKRGSRITLLASRQSWWRHQMETFSALLAICPGYSPVPGEFPTQRPMTRSFDVYFDLRPNKRLSKRSLGWWFETLSPPLWRHRIEFDHLGRRNTIFESIDGWIMFVHQGSLNRTKQNRVQTICEMLYVVNIPAHHGGLEGFVSITDLFPDFPRGT